MGLLWLFALVLVVAIVVYLMRYLGASRREPSDEDRYRSARAQHAATQQDAIATLDSRLARGEIDSVSYDAMRSRLEPRRWDGSERRNSDSDRRTADNARAEQRLSR